MKVRVNQRNGRVIGTEYCCEDMSKLGMQGVLLYEVNPELMFGMLASGPGEKEVKVPFTSCPYCNAEVEFIRVEGLGSRSDGEETGPTMGMGE